jgi:hypothetical protein
MTSELHYQAKRLLIAFRDNWAYANALRFRRSVEEASGSSNWETILQASQTRAQELFQPALSDLENDVPIAPVLAQLLQRLEAPQK